MTYFKHELLLDHEALLDSLEAQYAYYYSSASAASRQGHSVPPRSGPAQFDSMKIVQQSLSSAGFSQAVIDTSLACLRKSSRVLYAKRWDKYISFCLKQHQDPISAHVSVVLDFLQELSDSLHRCCQRLCYCYFTLASISGPD